MTDEELIARLNNLFWMLKEDGHHTRANTASFAAARLDAQAAEIERLRGEVAMAVEALEKLSTPHGFSGVAILGRRLSESLMGREIRARMEYARSTLAELTGAKNE